MGAEKHRFSPVHVNVHLLKEDESVPSPAASLTNVADHKNDLTRSTTDFVEEIDVNSVVSAVRKAIEKAQESIRITKESVDRKTKGLQNVSNKTFKDSFKVECTTSHVSSDFIDGKKLLVAKKAIDEINEKILECSIQVPSCNQNNTSDAAHGDQTKNMFVDDYKGKMKVVGTIADVLEHPNLEDEQESVDRVDVDTLRELKQNRDEVVSQGYYQNESEKLEEVLERKDAENVESDKEGEGVFEWFDNENEFEDEDDAEIHKEGTSEVFCETEDGVQTCEVNLHDDCEMKQDDNITAESKVETLDRSCDQEVNVKSAGDDKVSEEADTINGFYAASNVVDMYDNIVETTGEVDDVTEASGTFHKEDTKSMEGADASEKDEFDEKTSMVQTAFNDDEYEVPYEENDAHRVKTDGGESEKQQNVIDKLTDLGSENDGNANEINDSLESRYRDKEYENEEPGPSNVSGKDHFRRIYEEAAAKERERVKNRLVVEKAISEARERAFKEARERAERQRAAVEKAIGEVRQRMIAKARAKVSKASVVSKSSSAESKRRAERAAVERATSEALQSALEKAIPQKTVSDLNSFESALRTKAKLEKQNRIMERAAKAIAEKEKRYRLAQKEQAERNSLAENLDAEIKRWSNGKEGNLRALLSTLQYILGPDSGWQPISLTQIITTSDVKRAYRKATLCVHPDKLQQWGASIEHKYICEKVFDLLKVAWKRFNFEER